MKDYVKYWTPALVVAIAFVGFHLGGNWVWLAIASFPTLAVLDTLVGRDYSTRNIRTGPLAYVPVWISAIGPLLLYFALGWRVSVESLTAWQSFGAILGVAWMGVVPAVPATHELYHTRNPKARFVGRLCQLCYLDCMRDVAHVVGHHIDVATLDDSDTARRGDNLYAFTLHSLIHSTKTEFAMEAAALRKKGLGTWDIHHRFYRAVLALVIFHILMFAVGGWIAVLCALAAQLIARAWVESFNYFQHYGLVRVKGMPIGRRHVWNHLGWLSRTMAFEITNHADHHLNSYQEFYKLVPHKQAIPMPSVFICFLAALVPPVWHSMIIKPALRRWDLEFATSEERAFAAQENRRAGWPDWQSEPDARVGEAATVEI